MKTNSKKEILELLESGKISAEEAARMLSDASNQSTESSAQMEPSIPPSPVKTKGREDGPTMFRVRVRNLDTGENKVSVNIPVRMLKFGLKLGGRFAPELEGLNLNEINEMVTGMESGMLVEVQNEESNEHVQVYLD